MNQKPAVVLLMPGIRDASAGHLVSVYPAEGCGALVGTCDANSFRITESVALTNTETDRSGDRFSIDPLEYAALERQLAVRNDGNAVIGFFHSHPDAPPVPSSTDLDRAMGLYEFTRTQYLYAIQSIEQGRAGELRFWVLDDSANSFKEL